MLDNNTTVPVVTVSATLEPRTEATVNFFQGIALVAKFVQTARYFGVPNRPLFGFQFIRVAHQALPWSIDSIVEFARRWGIEHPGNRGPLPFEWIESDF